MASDLIVGLAQATVNGTTLFGSNYHAGPGQRLRLQRVEGGQHSADEFVRASYLRLPQARETVTVLGEQPDGCWGFVHGVNENHVAIGVTSWQSRLSAEGGGLTGTDLARLALERSHTALQAVDILTDLIMRHGQCPEVIAGRTGAPGDNLFLVADQREAFVVEAAGRFWALLECRQVRVATDVALIRQDWQRIAPGLAGLAIAEGWWNDDGSKLDFFGALGAPAPAHAAARRRWGRATLALEQQTGAIDSAFLRRLLFDHHDSTSATGTHRPTDPLAGSCMSALVGGGAPALAWCAFGPPRMAVYFPIWLDGDLPAAFQGAHDGIDVWQQTQDLGAYADGDVGDRARLGTTLEQLQASFEQDVEALLPQASLWKRQGDRLTLRQRTTALMQEHVRRFAEACRMLSGIAERVEREPARVSEEEFVSYIS